MDALKPDIPTIDEQSYLMGCSLNEALFKYCSPVAIRNYELAIKPTKTPMASAEVDKTLIGFLAVTTQAIQHFQNQQENTKNSIEVLYREIRFLIKNGRLIPYSYQLPRKLSDMPEAKSLLAYSGDFGEELNPTKAHEIAEFVGANSPIDKKVATVGQTQFGQFMTEVDGDTGDGLVRSALNGAIARENGWALDDSRIKDVVNG